MKNWGGLCWLVGANGFLGFGIWNLLHFFDGFFFVFCACFLIVQLLVSGYENSFLLLQLYDSMTLAPNKRAR